VPAMAAVESNQIDVDPLHSILLCGNRPELRTLARSELEEEVALEKNSATK
jgi:hypothetical protein